MFVRNAFNVGFCGMGSREGFLGFQLLAFTASRCARVP